jgi:hypothetical protein
LSKTPFQNLIFLDEDTEKFSNQTADFKNIKLTSKTDLKD